MKNISCSIPANLVGKWGYYVGINPFKPIVINPDGSGNLSTLNVGKWSANGNIIIFSKLNNEPPISGSAQYSIIDGKLFFSEPLSGDLLNEFKDFMPPLMQDGLVKIV